VLFMDWVHILQIILNKHYLLVLFKAGVHGMLKLNAEASTTNFKLVAQLILIIWMLELDDVHINIQIHYLSNGLCENFGITMGLLEISLYVYVFSLFTNILLISS
jgi:hypothetical protein